MSGFVSPYQALDLQPGANADQITAAWKRLICEHHPDRAVPAMFASANARSAEINAAYQHLFLQSRRVTTTRRRATPSPAFSRLVAGTSLGLAFARTLLAALGQMRSAAV